MRIAFDVDGTLIDKNSKPRHFVIDLMGWFYANGIGLQPETKIYVWSGSFSEKSLDVASTKT